MFVIIFKIFVHSCRLQTSGYNRKRKGYRNERNDVQQRCRVPLHTAVRKNRTVFEEMFGKWSVVRRGTAMWKYEVIVLNNLFLLIMCFCFVCFRGHWWGARHVKLGHQHWNWRWYCPVPIDSSGYCLSETVSIFSLSDLKVY